MDPPPPDPVRGSRAAILNTAWSMVAGGIVLLAIGLLLGLFAGLFLGVWVTVVGAMLVVLAAAWFWTSEAVPDRVLAERMAQRRSAHEPPTGSTGSARTIPPDPDPPA